MALARAIRSSHHPIWLQLSWFLDHDYAAFFSLYANSVRISVTTWANILQRLVLSPAWTSDVAHPTLFHDFDSLDVGVGAMDGLTPTQRRFAVALWAAGDLRSTQETI